LSRFDSAWTIPGERGTVKEATGLKRSDRWATRRYYDVALTSDGEKESDVSSGSAAFDETHSSLVRQRKKGSVEELNFIACARELILDVDEDGTLGIIFVSFSLNTTRGCLELGPIIRGSNLDDNDLKRHILLAIHYGVPVYPEDEQSMVELQRVYRSLLEEGLELESGKGPTQYVVMEPRTFTTANRSVDREKWLPFTSYQPADTLLQAEREHELAEAARILANLRSSVTKLAACLQDDVRDEASLQGCLTSHPILFGLEYKRILPKHRLGSEYEMDYALQHITGYFDLVEIEASSHNLYTRGGNPAAALTHAEQQVLDWLQWIEENHEYARKRLPGIMRPRGYVIIGRSHSLSENDRIRLDRRNASWGESLTVLTFDDLLEQATNMLRLFERSALPEASGP
jgi:hypothetical protein